MKLFNYFLMIALFSASIHVGKAQTPTPPNGKKWQKIEALSDEFSGNSLNTNKWDNQDPQWEGRPPARFEKSSVKVGNGNLQITASKKSNPSGRWTHNGGLVRSKTKNTYGYYEVRMKANKTFMSSTFWLINKRNEFQGCDFRTTELDVTENVGINSGGQSWINRNIVTINSNTHSRGARCASTPQGIRGDKSDIGEPAYAGYHTYGVWWKGPKELLFYLDGRFVHKITPVANFNLAMYLRMVVETYDWNPPKAGKDGMNDTAANRTTYYDWIRSYKLVNDDGNSGGVDKVAFNNAPTTISPQSSYSFNIDYEASANREIVVEFWSATNWLASNKVTVSKGKGTQSVTVDLPSVPASGSGYVYKTHIRPVGTTWREALDRDQINNVTVQTNTNQLPNVSFTGVTNGSALVTGASIQPTVIATDADGTIANVKLYLNNQFVRQENFAPYEWGHINDRDNQLKNLSAGSYTLKATATDNDGAEGSQSISFTVSDPNAQLIADGTYFITSSVGNQRLLSRALENHSARMHDPGNFDDQKWIFTHISDNTYTIKNKGTNRYLEVPYGACNDGANVATWTDARNLHKQWKVVKNGEGVFGIKPMHCISSGLDRAAGAQNANVQVWGYSTSNTNQKWKVIQDNRISKAAITREVASLSESFSIYPNPVTEMLYVKTDHKDVDIQVFDMLGKAVLSRVLYSKNNDTMIDVLNLEEGLYFISVDGSQPVKFYKR